MADNTEEKLSAAVSEAFLEYEEEMVKYPAYAGMPDLRYPDGHIQWETPSNRTGGAFRDSHDKRLHWWEEKARSLDISTTEDKWISKVAKRIHPTGVRPCKVCGRLMEIRYAYLGARFISRVNKLSFFDPTDMELTETTHILDFVASFVDLYGQQAFRVLPALLKAKAAPHPPACQIPLIAGFSGWTKCIFHLSRNRFWDLGQCQMHRIVWMVFILTTAVADLPLTLVALRKTWHRILGIDVRLKIGVTGTGYWQTC